MAFRIVLHAEGAGETQGDTLRLPPAPGEVLAEEHLGPGHLLGHAKEMLAACLAVRADAHAARREIAQTLDMDQLGRESSSFALFVADMRPAPG